MNSYTSPTTKVIFRGTQIVWYILGIIETLLAFRFILKLLAANPSSGFVSFIYGITQPLVQPFISVFKTNVIEGSVFEWVTLLAMLVYWLIAIGIIRLLFMSRTVSTPEAAHRINKRRGL